jgi:hypothetical protein
VFQVFGGRIMADGGRIDAGVEFIAGTAEGRA